MRFARLALISAAVFAVHLAAPPSARADMIVMESTDPGFHVGVRVPGDRIRKRQMQKGTYVRVLDLSTGRMRAFGDTDSADDENYHPKRKKKYPPGH